MNNTNSTSRNARFGRIRQRRRATTNDERVAHTKPVDKTHSAPHNHPAPALPPIPPLHPPTFTTSRAHAQLSRPPSRHRDDTHSNTEYACEARPRNARTQPPRHTQRRVARSPRRGKNNHNGLARPNTHDDELVAASRGRRGQRAPHHTRH